MANKFAVNKTTAPSSNKFAINKADIKQPESFGKIYSKDGYIYIKIDGYQIESGEFIKKLKNSTKEYLNKKFWLLKKEQDESAQTLLDIIPQEMLNDLMKAKRVGINKVYQYVAAQQKNGDYYIHLIPQVPAFFGGVPQVERKLGDEQIAYIGINSKTSKVGTIVPPKRKRG